MNKICTSLEQSKKLIELGIAVNTADMCYYYDHNWSNEHIEIPKVWDNNYEQFIPESEEDDIPAWSLSAMLRLIPRFTLEREISGDDEDEFLLTYRYNTICNEDLVDAAFGMICWLKEHKKI